MSVLLLLRGLLGEPIVDLMSILAGADAAMVLVKGKPTSR